MLIFFRSCHKRFSVKNTVHKNFVIFTGKHLCWSLFLIKLQAFRHATLLKRESNRYVPVINAKFLRTLILKDSCKQRLLKIYLLFRFLENNLEVAVCHHSAFCKILRKANISESLFNEAAEL